MATRAGAGFSKPAGGLADNATVTKTGSVALAGAGHLSVSMKLTLRAASVFAGSGLLLVNAVVFPHPVFLGSGSLSVNTIVRKDGSAVFNGNGRMCVQAIRRIGPPGIGLNNTTQGPGPTSQKVVFGAG